MKPTLKWQQLLHAKASDESLRNDLRALYASAKPAIAEVVLQSDCPNACRHCIYPPDYHRHNKVLTKEAWASGLHNLYHTLGLRRFIFSGRHLGTTELEIIAAFRSRHQDVEWGLIMDGANLSRHLNDVLDLKPDWLDISVDGTESSHDLQRNRQGDYRVTVEALSKVANSKQINLINVLTCLTTINVNDVIEMMRELNDIGLKNFFMSPMVAVSGVRPDIGLKVSSKALSVFFEKLLGNADRMDDAYLEVALYDPGDLAALARPLASMPQGPAYAETALEWVKPGGNEVHVVFFPTSLAGVTEVIVNSDGSIIPPRVVSHGRIEAQYRFGSINNLPTDIDKQGWVCPENAIDFYIEMLIEEIKQLGKCTLLESKLFDP